MSSVFAARTACKVIFFFCRRTTEDSKKGPVIPLATKEQVSFVDQHLTTLADMCQTHSGMRVNLTVEGKFCRIEPVTRGNLSEAVKYLQMTLKLITTSNLEIPRSDVAEWLTSTTFGQQWLQDISTHYDSVITVLKHSKSQVTTALLSNLLIIHLY